jgi:hypothetical protein
MSLPVKIPRFRAKLSKSEKRSSCLEAQKRRRSLNPTRDDLPSKILVEQFCVRKKKSTFVRDAMLRRIQFGEEFKQDTDLRSIKPIDRAPRSFVQDDPPSTPPHYWSLEDIGEPVMITPQEQNLIQK